VYVKPPVSQKHIDLLGNTCVFVRTYGFTHTKHQKLKGTQWRTDFGSTRDGMKSHGFIEKTLIFPGINQIMYLGLSKRCIFLARKVVVLIIEMPTTIGYLSHRVPFNF